MEAKLLLYKKPKLKKPVLIQGLPGIGNIGKIVVSYLIAELNAEKMADIVSPHLPGLVLISPDNVVEPLTIEVYLYKGKGRDLVLVTGEAQPISDFGQYECCNLLIDFCEEFGISEVVTVGGYGIGRQVKEPKVYGIVTSEDLVKHYEKYGIVFQKENTIGTIIGMNGLLLTFAKMRDIRGICLLAETLGYPLLSDPKAAEQVIKILMDMFGLKVNLEKLEEAVKDLDRLWRHLEEQTRKMHEKKGVSEYSSYIG